VWVYPPKKKESALHSVSTSQRTQCVSIRWTGSSSVVHRLRCTIQLEKTPDCVEIFFYVNHGDKHGNQWKLKVSANDLTLLVLTCFRLHLFSVLVKFFTPYVAFTKGAVLFKSE
jgi:hypothetical protein